MFSFSDIENVDWPTIKSTLSSADSWSICRLGDYFVKTNRNKRRRSYEKPIRKEKMLKNDEHMLINNDNNNTIDEYDMLDDIYKNQPLFRLMPQTSMSSNRHIQPIVEIGERFSSEKKCLKKFFFVGDDSDRILRDYHMFSIDWFTDNKPEAPLRVIPSRCRHGINHLIEDSSVLDLSCGKNKSKFKKNTFPLV